MAQNCKYRVRKKKLHHQKRERIGTESQCSAGCTHFDTYPAVIEGEVGHRGGQVTCILAPSVTGLTQKDNLSHSHSYGQFRTTS